MASNSNVVVVSGRLTRDPEQRQAGQTNVTDFRLAVNGRKKSGDGWEDVANFFDVAAFGNTGDQVARFLSKGSQCLVTGRLQWREWEQDGKKREKVSIVANTVEFVGGKQEQPSGEVAIDSDFSQGSVNTDDVPF